MIADRRVTVAHVITRFDVGGAQETALRLAAGLDRDRYRAVVLTGTDPGSGGSLRKQARSAGVEVLEVPDLVGPIRPVSDVRAVRQVIALLREQQADLVHTHSSKAGVVGRLAARRTGLPAVHMVHGWSFNDDPHPMVRSAYVMVERSLARWTERLVVVTPQDQVAGLRHRIGSPAQYRLVRSGIELQGRALPTEAAAARAEVRQELGMEPGAHLIVSVGRLEPQKDPETMVRSFAAGFGGDPSVALALVGGGSLRDDVAALAHQLGVGPRVHLLGVRHDVRRLLMAADGFVLTSRWEGLPRAVLEAMDVGLPVVAADVGGVSDVVIDGVTGLLVPPASVSAASTAMRRLRADPALASRLADAASDGLEEFSAASMLRALDAVYDEVLPAGAGR